MRVAHQNYERMKDVVFNPTEREKFDYTYMLDLCDRVNRIDGGYDDMYTLEVLTVMRRGDGADYVEVGIELEHDGP
jgi:hypothetical protein